MRKIDPHDFRIASRSTSRDTSRRIALNPAPGCRTTICPDNVCQTNCRLRILRVQAAELTWEGPAASPLLLYIGVLMYAGPKVSSRYYGRNLFVVGSKSAGGGSARFSHATSFERRAKGENQWRR